MVFNLFPVGTTSIFRQVYHPVEVVMVSIKFDMSSYPYVEDIVTGGLASFLKCAMFRTMLP